MKAGYGKTVRPVCAADGGQLFTGRLLRPDSIEGPVMGLDRRGCVVQPRPPANWANWQQEEPVDEAKPFRSPNGKSGKPSRSVKANQGAAGVDGQSIADFEADLSGNLYKLWNRLSSGSYFPPPVRRVDIPKVRWRYPAVGHSNGR